MRLRPVGTVAALLAVAIALSWAASRSQHPLHLRSRGPVQRTGASGSPEDLAEARRRLSAFRSYRAMFDLGAVRSTRRAEGGAVELDVDLRSLARPELIHLGWPELEEAVPAGTTVRVEIADGRVSESWWFACPGGCVLDLFAGAPPDRPLPSEVPGVPAVVARFRFNPTRLRTLALGGRSQDALVRRAELVEQILGRPLREPFADDLTGFGSVALYRVSSHVRGLVVVDLGRDDRIRSLVDLAVGLAALTRGATVRSHRDVPIGSWSKASGGGIAVAVDGPRLLVADDPARLEDAIDLRRDPADPEPPRLEPVGASLRLSGTGSLDATLTRDGNRWRLDTSGDGPLADNEILRSWLRGLKAAAQRGDD